MVQFRIRAAAASWPYWTLFLALVPWVLTLTGCHNSCYLFISNPGGGSGIGVSTGSSGCPTVTLVGTMHVAGRTRPGCEFCGQADQIRHLLLTLSGIELHPAADGGVAPAEWLELNPQLGLQPRQFDFGESGSSVTSVVSMVDGATVPAGSYDRIRLRLAPSTAVTWGQIAGESSCGQMQLSCVVMGDGRVLPVSLESDELELRLDAEGDASGRFRIVPNTLSQLSIELTPVWSATSQSQQSVRLLLRPMIESPL